jgi:hypothetical protein
MDVSAKTFVSAKHVYEKVIIQAGEVGNAS